MEAVDVFTRVDMVCNALLVDVFWEGELDDNAVYFGVVIDVVDFSQELLLGDGGVESTDFGDKAEFGTFFFFVSDVGFACGVVAHEYGDEFGSSFALSHKGVNLVFEFGREGGGGFFAI